MVSAWLTGTVAVNIASRKSTPAVLPLRGNKSLTGIALLLMRLPYCLASIWTMARIDRTTHGRMGFNFRTGITDDLGLRRFDHRVGQMSFVPI
jgi:hypothetical protein